MAKKTARKQKPAAQKAVVKNGAAKKAPKAAPAKSRPSARVMASLSAAQPVSATKPSDLEAFLAVLRDTAKPIEARFAALQSLGAARFASPDFAAIQGDYIAALRAVSSDSDEEMRRRALGILTRDKDPYATKKLLDGLKNPDQALLPPEKALQLLASDIHTEAYPIAREVVKNPPNPTARREALRLLAADAASAPQFVAILKDKNETPEIRQISAAALHALQPEKLQQVAREMVLDPDEHDDIRQTSLTALTQFGGADLAQDKDLMDRVNDLSTASSSAVKSSARRFLGKYSNA